MNDELRAMYDADVWDHRQGFALGTPDYVAMRERDRARRRRTAELIAAQTLQTADDFYHAARLFQHGDTPSDAWQAHILALRACELGAQPARWMAAAAYDRWLMYQGRPQHYGTQYVSDGRRQRLWDVDPATTDDERAAWDVPPLAEQLRKAEEATRLDPPRPIDWADAPAWLQAAAARWAREEGWEREM